MKKIKDVTTIRILKVLRYLKLFLKGDTTLEYLLERYENLNNLDKKDGK